MDFTISPELDDLRRRIAAFVDWVRQEVAGDQAEASADMAPIGALIV